ncbi:protocadherin Fat 3-like [Haliotis rufescens]|uniref:protocadherin Fat 3-like n=1 Tax=Haliotis rufescens TaxID=6454 RepID=UPI00201EB763|nr:protocadherin Fat 3-like [Haliotis rufescens]
MTASTRTHMEGVGHVFAVFLLLLKNPASSILQFKTSLTGTIFEGSSTRINVVCLGCTEEPDAGRILTVRKEQITPQFQCGGCFDIYTKLDGLSVNDWCIFYLPSQGKLNYTMVQEYTMTASCTNGVDTPITTSVLLKVSTNEPPRIDSLQQTCPTPIDAKLTNAGDTIYNTLHTSISDPDGDITYCSMTTIPPSTNVEIDPVTCIIRAKKNLEMECHPSITFLVSVNDGTNPNVGPISITCDITNYLPAPIDSKLNRSISVREDHPKGTVMYTFDPPTVNPAVIYAIIHVTPPQAHSLFSVENGRSSITLNEELDYENPLFADIYLNISADNGNCDLVYQYLNVRPIEVNEPPVLSPKVYYQQVNEESIYVNPVFLCEDEDRGDRCQFRIVGGNDEGRFQINRDTGEITARYNIDNNVRELNWTLIIEAVDLQGLTDNATVNLNIRDINDNRPYFTHGGGIAYTVTECTGLGILPVRFAASDDDSDYKGNNIITFTPARSDCIQIHADGTVHLLKTLLQPESCVLSTRAVDHGEYPGPLTSQITATVTVTSSDCPPTPAPPTTEYVTEATTVTTEPPTTTSTAVNNNGPVLHLLGGPLALLLFYML